MPKERIYGVLHEGHANDVTCDNDLSVQWERASEAYENVEDGFSGYVSLSLVPKTTFIPVAGMIMDRQSINRLIRVLRRARDHAWGSDA